jgi:DHA3 family macrolide efflux protein-like MFS transporter
MIQEQDRQTGGMRTFSIIWAGQLVSLLGTNMTGFALPIYVFGQTERVRELALLGLAYTLPLILFSPLTGAIVDRANRKRVMILSDLMAGLMSVVVLLLVWTDSLEIWHLFITSAVSGAFQGMQWPAYSAIISVMIPKKQYARAHGMISLAQSGSNVFAPLLAGSLLGIVGLPAILLIDVVTFLFAIGSLLLARIPNPPRTDEGREGQGSLWRESLYGFQYIWRRPSLLWLQLVFFAGNFLVTLAITTLPAMILFRTDQNELIFGTIQSAGAAGAVAGALLMSAWGGPKRLIRGVLFGWIGSGLLGLVVVGLGRTAVVWAVAAFAGYFFLPIVNGSNQAIWQAKVAPDVQGRVFSVRRLIAWAVIPLANLLVIPLADDILEPAMRQGGALADSLGWLVGPGPGAGMALLMVGAGLLIVLVTLAAFLTPTITRVEEILPDHELAREGPGQAGLETADEGLFAD